jgi:hypothetical protein
MIKPFYIILFLIFLYSCNVSTSENGMVATTEETTGDTTSGTAVSALNPVIMPYWLPGVWVYSSARSKIKEVWTIENDSTYSGTAYLTTNGVTVVSEYISLEIRNGLMFYKPTPQLSNTDKKTHSFIYTEGHNDSLVFEDPMNDFPQKIVYYRFSKDSIFAILTGTTPDGPDTVVFPMEKE